MSATILDRRPSASAFELRTLSCRSLVADLEVAAAFVAVAGFIYAVVGTGGRQAGVTSWAILAAIPLLVVTRPWRRVPTRELALSASLAVAAVVIPLVTPLGLSSAGNLTSFLYAPIAYVAVRSFLTTPERRQLLTTLLFISVVVEFSTIWPVWVGENNRKFDLVGTFYWHNPFGIFVVALGVLAAVVAVTGQRPLRLLATLVAPAALALAYLAHSRGSELALLVVSCIFLVVLARRHMWRAVGMTAGLVASAAGIATLMLLRVSPGHIAAGDTIGRMTHISLSATSSFRFDFWVAALHIFARAPLVGHGFGTFSYLSARYLPGGQPEANWAHSAPLQTLTDGGLVLGLPLIAAMLFAALRALNRARLTWRLDNRVDSIRLGASLALLALLIHSCIDFDVQYPALVAFGALLAALAAPDPRPRTAPTRVALGLRVSIPSLAFMTAAVVTGLVMVSNYWHTGERLDTAQLKLETGDTSAAVAAASSMVSPTFPDPRAASWLVMQADDGVPMSGPVLTKALKASRAYSQVDGNFRKVWLKEKHSAAIR